jgi:hypothetical protein
MPPGCLGRAGNSPGPARFPPGARRRRCQRMPRRARAVHGRPGDGDSQGEHQGERQARRRARHAAVVTWQSDGKLVNKRPSRRYRAIFQSEPHNYRSQARA